MQRVPARLVKHPAKLPHHQDNSRGELLQNPMRTLHQCKGKDRCAAQEAIALKFTQASNEEHAEHKYLMAKTRDNVTKHEQRLQDRKLDKIQKLGENQRGRPPRGQYRRQPPQRGRAMTRTGEERPLYSREWPHHGKPHNHSLNQTALPLVPPAAPLQAQVTAPTPALMTLGCWDSCCCGLGQTSLPSSCHQPAASQCSSIHRRPCWNSPQPQPGKHTSLLGDGLQHF